MTYNVGQTINASDYNNFRGSIAVNTAYPDSSAATNKLAALIGVGYGNRGYGQTAETIPSVSSGEVITALQWNSLRSAMNILNVHQGAAATLPAAVSAGNTILANDGTSSRPNVAVLINSFDTGRLNYDISQMTLSSVLSSVRSTSWNISVYHEFTATFASENAARYFFNTGGTVYVSASRVSGTVSSLNTDISNILSAMGTIKVSASTTTRTGTGGTVSAIGYYGLTSTYQNLFTVTGTSAIYTLKGRVENIAGLNGGNGTLIRFQAVFETGLSSYFQADGTLTSAVSQLLAGGVLTVTAPAWATTVSL